MGYQALIIFALAISVHLLAGRIVSEHLAKLASEREKREEIARMWGR